VTSHQHLIKTIAWFFVYLVALAKILYLDDGIRGHRQILSGSSETRQNRGRPPPATRPFPQSPVPRPNASAKCPDEHSPRESTEHRRWKSQLPASMLIPTARVNQQRQQKRRAVGQGQQEAGQAKQDE